MMVAVMMMMTQYLMRTVTNIARNPGASFGVVLRRLVKLVGAGQKLPKMV